jgi:hypothetical protein
VVKPAVKPVPAPTAAPIPANGAPATAPIPTAAGTVLLPDSNKEDNELVIVSVKNLAPFNGSLNILNPSVANACSFSEAGIDCNSFSYSATLESSSALGTLPIGSALAIFPCNCPF